MWSITAEIVPTPGEERPFKIVFRDANQSVIAEEQVATIAEAHALMKAKLRAIDEGENADPAPTFH